MTAPRGTNIFIPSPDQVLLSGEKHDGIRMMTHLAVFFALLSLDPSCVCVSLDCVRNDSQVYGRETDEIK